jgi:hypothetical protein
LLFASLIWVFGGFLKIDFWGTESNASLTMVLLANGYYGSHPHSWHAAYICAIHGA